MKKQKLAKEKAIPIRHVDVDVNTSASNSEHTFWLDLPIFSQDYTFWQFIKDSGNAWTFSFAGGYFAKVENLFTLKLSHTDEQWFDTAISYRIKQIPTGRALDEYYDPITVDNVRISFINKQHTYSYLLKFKNKIKTKDGYSFGEDSKIDLGWDTDTGFEIIITVNVSKVLSPDGKMASPNALPIQSVDTSFSKYFLAEELSDCKVIAGEGVFPAHRFVLSEISVFCKKMFSAEMLENQTREWKIDDFDPVVVQAFLEFAYTGKSASLTFDSENTEIVKELFRMSHKYEVVPLKTQTEILLKCLLSEENVVSIFQLGSLYESKCLKAAAKSYFGRFKHQVLPNMDAFRELLKNHLYDDDMIYELTFQ